MFKAFFATPRTIEGFIKSDVGAQASLPAGEQEQARMPALPRIVPEIQDCA